MDNTTISSFVNRFKRGSKSFRRIFRAKKSELIPNNMVRFAANTETIIGLDLSKKLNASWNFGYLDNTLRTFIFKMHNNQLGYNHVVAHFADNIEPYCSFCLLTRNHAPARDTALHVFYMPNSGTTKRKFLFMGIRGALHSKKIWSLRLFQYAQHRKQHNPIYCD